MHRPFASSLAAAVVALLVVSATLTTAVAAPEPTDPSRSGANERRPWNGRAREWKPAPRKRVPEDRFAMAGGCYTLRGPAGYVARTDGGYTLTKGRGGAEPFHFQATDLGSYLLYDSQERFLAASEGVLGEVAYGATRSQPGQIVGGLTLEQTDRAADELARSPANSASGRGAELVAAPDAGPLADWTVEKAAGGYLFGLEETDQVLRGGEGEPTLAAADAGTPFVLELTSGCARFPEIEANVSGPVVGAKSAIQETRGFFDAHLHMMAFEFLGGRARCGRPWHPYGVEHALKDCPDHEPGGFGAVLEQVLTKRPGQGHAPGGWPTFEGWPTHYSLTHEQVYYKWLERAWRGGLRMFTNLLVDNGQLCRIYPYKRNSCNEMDGVRLQAQRIRELERYIDAQSGGPGEGWFRIVTDPFEARRVINEGKLAVVLGIEVSVPLDCGLVMEIPQCDLSKISAGLDEVYGLGVRQMELVNKFDNAFSGVAGDEGETGMVVNQGNKSETGHYWHMHTCADDAGPATDKTQMNFNDDERVPQEVKQFTGRDALAGAVFAAAGTSGAAPIYPEGPHCNELGLSELGKAMIEGMVARKMIFDPDHMSALAQDQALDLLEQKGYSGVVSSHGWSNSTIYPRIYDLGGVVTPYAGGSSSFVRSWEEHRTWANEDYYFGFGYGADTNGFGSQGGPREGNESNPVSYPFTGFGGVTVERQRSGTRTPYDINIDGVAHYGLYPDWIEDLRKQAGDAIVQDMERGTEAYLQMWERALGIAPDSCRDDIADLTAAQVDALERGDSAEKVLRTLGQPHVRLHDRFTYCVDEQQLDVKFDAKGLFLGVD